MSPPLRLASTTDGPVTVVTATGDLDLATAGEFRTAVAAVTATRLVIDLSGIVVCDSVGLGTLIWANQRFVEAGGWCGLCSPSPTLGKILAMAGLDQVIPVFPDRAAALRAGRGRRGLFRRR